MTNNNGSGHAVYNPVKLQVKPGGYKIYAVRVSDSYGPTFGDDIVISNNAARNTDSYTKCGYIYVPPPGYSSMVFCKFYTGSYNFTLTNIEVFYETTT